jgi:hypothetical protein
MEAELSKLTGQVVERSRERARANWLEADLQVRRWIASGQLSEARILKLAKILSKGLFNNGHPAGQYRTKIQYYRSGTRYTLLPLLPEKIRDEFLLCQATYCFTSCRSTTHGPVSLWVDERPPSHVKRSRAF